MAVVKNQAFALFPATLVVAHPNPATAFRPRNDQSKVVAQHAFIHSAMLGNMLSGRQNREHRGLHPRNTLQEADRLRASRAVLLGLLSVGIKPEGLPLFALSQNLLCVGDILEIRDLLPSCHNSF